MIERKIIINAEGDEKTIGTVASQSRIIYEDKKPTRVDIRKHFESAIEQQRLRSEADPGQSRCEVGIKTDARWVLVFGWSDWHLGSEHVDYDLFWRHYNLVKDTPNLYCNIIGDERDNFVIGKYKSGLFEGVMNPQQQADLVEEILRGVEHKVLCRVGGNHDGWTWEQSGSSLENYWFRQYPAPLMKVGGFEHLKINDVEYVGFVHHGQSVFNSSFNPNHASKRAFEFQGPYDFMQSGHTHVTESAHGYRWSDEYQKDTVQQRTGTYKLNDTYAKSKQLGRGQPPGACILFSTSEKRMMGFAKLEDGIEVMEALNYPAIAQGMVGLNH